MMRIKILIGLIVLVLVGAGVPGSLAQQQQPAGKSTREQSPATPDAKTVLNRVKEAFGQLSDYECILKLTTRKGSVVDNSVVKCYFKKPNMIRLDVLEGEKKGSRISRDAQGTIHGSKGGLLKLIKVEMEPGDERTRNLRGRPFWLADWGSVIAEEEMAVEKQWAMRVAGQQTYDGKPCYVLDIERRNDPHNVGITAERIWVSQPAPGVAQPWQILCREKFEGTTSVEKVEWYQVKTNVGLTNEIFQLK